MINVIYYLISLLVLIILWSEGSIREEITSVIIIIITAFIVIIQIIIHFCKSINLFIKKWRKINKI